MRVIYSINFFFLKIFFLEENINDFVAPLQIKMLVV